MRRRYAEVREEARDPPSPKKISDTTNVREHENTKHGKSTK